MLQGPDDRSKNKGTLHPTTRGHRVYKERLVAYLEPALAALPVDTGAPPPASDTSAPEVECVAADGQWHAGDVSIACTATDVGSGLADPADGSFSLATAVPQGTETADAATASRRVCDAAGNCTTAGPITGNMVDKRGPTVSIISPVPDAVYLLAQNVAGDYGCEDHGRARPAATGPFPPGRQSTLPPSGPSRSPSPPPTASGTRRWRPSTTRSTTTSAASSTRYAPCPA